MAPGLRHTVAVLALVAGPLGCRTVCDVEADRDQALCDILTTCSLGSYTDTEASLQACLAAQDTTLAGAGTCDPTCDGDDTCDDAARPDLRCPGFSRAAAATCLRHLRALADHADQCPTSLDTWVLPVACAEMCEGGPAVDLSAPAPPPPVGSIR